MWRFCGREGIETFTFVDHHVPYGSTTCDPTSKSPFGGALESTCSTIIRACEDIESIHVIRDSIGGRWQGLDGATTWTIRL